MTYIRCNKKECDNNNNEECCEHEISLIYHPDGKIEFFCNCDTTLNGEQIDELKDELKPKIKDKIKF